MKFPPTIICTDSTCYTTKYLKKEHSDYNFIKKPSTSNHNTNPEILKKYAEVQIRMESQRDVINTKIQLAKKQMAIIHQELLLEWKKFDDMSDEVYSFQKDYPECEVVIGVFEPNENGKDPAAIAQRKHSNLYDKVYQSLEDYGDKYVDGVLREYFP